MVQLALKAVKGVKKENSNNSSSGHTANDSDEATANNSTKETSSTTTADTAASEKKEHADDSESDNEQPNSDVGNARLVGKGAPTKKKSLWMVFNALLGATHVECVQARLDFLAFVLQHSAFVLSLEHLDTLWRY